MKAVRPTVSSLYLGRDDEGVYLNYSLDEGGFRVIALTPRQVMLLLEFSCQQVLHEARKT